MVEGLRHAPDWPLDDPPIEMIQTHISVVLLGSRHVLKLKKPVNFGFLDYTTLAKRRSACEAEVSLNRRLISLISRENITMNEFPRSKLRGIKAESSLLLFFAASCGEFTQRG